jgi:hypothetical protein
MLNFIETTNFNEDDLITNLTNRFMNQFLLEPRQATMLAMDIFDLLTESGTDFNTFNLEY